MNKLKIRSPGDFTKHEGFLVSGSIEDNNKNTWVGFLRIQITWVKPYHLNAKCNVAQRWWLHNEGYLGPQNTDEGILYIYSVLKPSSKHLCIFWWHKFCKMNKYYLDATNAHRWKCRYMNLLLRHSNNADK